MSTDLKLGFIFPFRVSQESAREQSPSPSVLARYLVFDLDEFERNEGVDCKELRPKVEGKHTYIHTAATRKSLDHTYEFKILNGRLIVAKQKQTNMETEKVLR